jgi:hypothetical protein
MSKEFYKSVNDFYHIPGGHIELGETRFQQYKTCVGS